jgi:hypothetical protein
LCAYRESFTIEDWENLPYSQKIICPFFCYAYGGGFLRQIMLGKPPILFTSDNVSKVWLLTFALFSHLPNDYLYKQWNRKKSVGRTLMVLGTHADAGCSIPGNFESMTTLFPNNPIAPYAAILITSSFGGSLCRYVEQKGRGVSATAEWCVKGESRSIAQSLVYAVMYALMRKVYDPRNGDKRARLYFVTFHLVKTFLKEYLDVEYDPIAELGMFVLRFLSRAVPKDTFSRKGLK